MITDRQRTKAIFFPLWMMNLMFTGAADREEEDFKVVWGYLDKACGEVLRGCDAKKMSYIMRRATRLHDGVLKDLIKGGSRSDKVGLIMAYILQAVVDADYLVVYEDSDLAIAIDAIFAGLEKARKQEKLDASARKQAVKTLRALQGEGYFEGVTLSED